MATGDADNFAARIRAALPARWFPVAADGEASPTPVLDAVLRGLGTAWAAVWELRQYVVAQARIATATGTWLDAIGSEFFGRGLLRRASESDTSYRRRIRSELFRPRGTRAAILRVLRDLTGRDGAVFEPRDPRDAGGWGSAGMTEGSGLAYGLAGGWGSLALPYQCFVTAYRPLGEGVGNVVGYYYGSGWAGGGYGVGAAQWIGEETYTGALSDLAIYDAVAKTMPIGTVAWTGIKA